MVTRPRKQDEHPTDLLFWFGNGHCASYRARVTADTEVSIGRTNSKRALGFVMSRGNREIDFVLDKDQVAELAAYLQITQGRLLKPLGRKPVQISLVRALQTQPKRKRRRKARARGAFAA